ncbi:MAG: preprotein translocase subunit SecG [Bacteroidales bacterium]|nr:preprotein translocase subunit SecG [Bacteroidales bacterium]MCI5618383.1 preprotein translocase subunit SecG [Rikenellaceae bacterium]
MNALFTIMVVLIVLAALLLTIVVLLQNGKGDGLASNFIAGNQTFGVRQTADILEKVTWGLVAFILVLAIITSFTTGTTGADIDVSNKIENITPQATPDFAPVPQEIPSQTNPTE